MNMLSIPQPSDSLNHADPHWRALFRGEFYGVKGADHQRHTRMGKTMHFGPLRVQRPFFPEGSDVLHMYLLHPPGGLVGGDYLAIEVTAVDQAGVLVTTPSAGKLYRNDSQLDQLQQVTLHIADNSVIEYLPQENIIFDGARGRLNTQVNIAGDGLFIGWEITCLGRPEGEALFTQGQLKQTLSVYHNEQLLFIDRLNLDASNGAMQSQVGLQGYSSFATFVINREIDSTVYHALIQIQETTNTQDLKLILGVTQKQGVLIIRALAHRAEPIRQLFEKIWQVLRPAVYNREACTPRIWNT